MQHVGPLFNNVLSNVTPLLKESCFYTHGMLTPEEFVNAGDELVLKCGTWMWSGCSKKYIVSYLPKDKQFLICRSVPEQFNSSNIKESTNEDGWTDCNTNSNSNSKKQDELIEDIDDFEENDIEDNVEDEENDIYVVNNNINNNINRYDISITYNNYYRTPQVWILGYNPDGSVIHPLNLLNNISSDHTNKTATIESHPHDGIRQLSIHPCKHSQTILSLVKHAKDKYNVKNSLFLFIKIISTIVPNINYDFTVNF